MSLATFGLLAIWLLSLADLTLTLRYIGVNSSGELNPVVAPMLAIHAVALVVLVKCGLTAAGTGILWWARKHKWASVGIGVVLLANIITLALWGWELLT